MACQSLDVFRKTGCQGCVRSASPDSTREARVVSEAGGLRLARKYKLVDLFVHFCASFRRRILSWGTFAEAMCYRFWHCSAVERCGAPYFEIP